ncbi:MAG: EAL domain-containing protein [Thermoanaerobaculia bacterium]|nr:EAL domain-containing protein [Thermoanaerobaculia bacterium]
MTERERGEGLKAWSRERLVAEVELLRSQLEAATRHREGIRTDLLDGSPGTSAGDLRTVDVPEPLAPRFLQAQNYVARYFRGYVHRPQEATISIAGERYVLLRAASLSVEFIELVTSLYEDQGPAEARNVADNLLFDIAHALGKADAKSFHEKMGVEDPIDRLSAGPIHFAFSGWAFVEISPESNPSPDEEYFLIYDHPFSFESDAWRAKGKQSDTPVCIMNAGYSSGWCEESFDVPLVAAEIECVAAGGDRCRFLMAPPSRIEEHLRRRGVPVDERDLETSPVTVPEFFERKRLEDELRRANETLEQRVEERTAELLEATEQLRLLGSAVESASEGIVILVRDEGSDLPRIEMVNRGFCRITGLDRGEAVGETLEILRVSEEDESLFEAMTESVERGEAFQGELNAVRGDGDQYALELHLMPAGRGDRPRHWTGIFRDVTQRRARVAALRHQALYDALTDLPNRILLYDRLEQAVLATPRSKGILAFLILDLDGFKEINDTFGHPTGDELLRQIGPRLEAVVRSTDTVARLGGDEFAVLLPEVGDREKAVDLARRILTAVQEPFRIQGQELVVGGSIGIVFCPDHGTDPATLMRRADVAMYVAKYGQRGVEVYSPEEDDRSPTRITMIGDLRRGIDEGQLEYLFQPQLRLADGAVDRIEAYVRWRHPERGLLRSRHFLPLIEPGNMAVSFTRTMVTELAHRWEQWRRQGIEIGISFNLIPKILRSPELPELLAEVLEDHPALPGMITLEVTEGGIFDEVDAALTSLDNLRELGLRLSIDDFGTGYSSLAHLRDLPVQEVKIDRVFVQGVPEEEQDIAIVRSTIHLAHSLGREIVAEGIERKETLEALKDLDCDLGQGHHLCEPLNEEDLQEWLAERGRPPR